MIPLDQLQVQVVESDEPMATLVATEYRYLGELVRRDVEARLKPIDLSIEAKEL